MIKTKPGNLLFVLILLVLSSCNTLEPNEAGYQFRRTLPKEYSELNYVYLESVYYMKVKINKTDYENYIQEHEMIPFVASIEDAKEMVVWDMDINRDWWDPSIEKQDTSAYYYVDDSPFPPYIAYAKYENGYMFLVSKSSKITIRLG